MQQHNSAEESHGEDQHSVDTQKPTADNIDYEYQAKEITKLQQTIPKNVTDPSSNSAVPRKPPPRNTQDDTSATHKINEMTQENPIASVETQLLENTAGKLVHTTNVFVNSNHAISLSECIPLGATVSQKIKAKIWSIEFLAHLS